MYFDIINKTKKKFNKIIGLLTLDDNWPDKLIICSRASHNSRFKRRTSFACRSSAEPYNDEPPDINDAALPCTVKTQTGKKSKQIKYSMRY